MTLTDAGPLVAVIDKGDSGHARRIAALPNLSKPLVTTLPCFTEAMYLLGRAGRFDFQDQLWRMYDIGLLTLHTLSVEELGGMRVLMAQYADRPMDLADASLVVAAETIGVKRVFTVDSDFLFYRLASGATLRIVP